MSSESDPVAVGATEGGDQVPGLTHFFARGELSVVHLGALAALFYGSAELGLLLTPPPHDFGVFWLPAAVATAALVLRPRRDWPALLLGGALPVNLLFELVQGRVWTMALAAAVANLATALTAALLLARQGPRERYFRSARTTWRSFVLLAVAPVTGTAIGVTIFSLVQGGAPLEMAAVWWMADVTGLYALLPAFVIGAEMRPRLRARDLAVAGVATAFLLVVAGWIFVAPQGLAGPMRRSVWLQVPLLWIGLRLGRRGAAIAAFLLALVGTWGTSRGLGLLADIPSQPLRLLVVQLSICVCGAVAVTFAASVSSRQRAVTEARRRTAESERLADELGRALDEIRTLKGLIPICASCRKLRDDDGTWKALEKYFAEHTDAQLTHGICPDCVRRLYPEHQEASAAGI